MRVKVGTFLRMALVVILFSCSFPVHVQGYTVDSILMCGDIDDITSEPVGVGSIFLTHSVNAYCWVNLTETTGSLVVRFDWRNTAEELYVSHQKTTEDLGSGLARVYDYIEIDGNLPSSDPGMWTVQVYADDTLLEETTFTIVDYDAIIERQDALEIQVAEIVESVYELIASKEALQEDLEERISDFEDLLSDYNELNDAYESLDTIYAGAQEDYDSLTEDYNELILNYNQLNDDYDALENDYESLAAQRSNSRNMMYVSIAVAIISIIAAIYLYTKK